MMQLSPSPDQPLFTVGTVGGRCYGHAEGTAGEDEAGYGVAAAVAT